MDSKLCPRHTTRFKRSCPTRDSKTLATSLAMREDTMFKKAYELSTLCDIELCILYYSRDGELVKTWPEDKAKVRDMAERFSRLSERDKRKKNTNLSECLAKKMSQEKKDDSYKYLQKLLEMEASLERRLPILEDHLRLLEDQSRQQWTEPLTNPLSDLPILQDQLPLLSAPSDYDGIPQPLIDLSSSLPDDPSQQQWTEPLVKNPLSKLPVLQDQLPLLLAPSNYGGIPQPLIDLSTSLHDDPPQQQWTEPLVNNPLSDLPSLNLLHHDPSKFSIFLFNHDNGNFTQLGSSFDQSFNNLSSTSLLGAQGFGGCSNNNIVDIPPPLMQTFSSSYY